MTDAGRAAFFLDAALAARTSSRTPDDQAARRNSHFLFTLHLHQERADKSSKAAGQWVLESGCVSSVSEAVSI